MTATKIGVNRRKSGSDLGEGQGRIEQLAKGAAVPRGKRFRTSAAESGLKTWISSLKLD